MLLAILALPLSLGWKGIGWELREYLALFFEVDACALGGLYDRGRSPAARVSPDNDLWGDLSPVPARPSLYEAFSWCRCGGRAAGRGPRRLAGARGRPLEPPLKVKRESPQSGLGCRLWEPDPPRRVPGRPEL